MLYFKLFGPFSIVDENGFDRRPKLMKARAILAVLAATPGHSHSRSWFQTLLWEDRQPEQAQSSLRSALADIRRHFGPYADAILADHSDVALIPDLISIEQEEGTGSPEKFLEGFDIAHAHGFEDWLREARAIRNFEPEYSDHASRTVPPEIQRSRFRERGGPQKKSIGCRIFLASSGNGTDTIARLQCDVIVDSIAKTMDDLRIAETVDGRGTPSSDLLMAATDSGCSLILVSEAAETNSGSIARLRAIEADGGRLIWSKSLTGDPTLDLEDPSTIGLVAEFVDILSERLIRPYNWQTDNMPASLMAVMGVNHIFKLGSQNYDTADELLKRAHENDPRGSYLAWRAFLRTFLVGELEHVDKDAVTEEGTTLARRALETEPHNSMVLALCAHVENMLHNDFGNAFDLSSRALELNRCNPLAWVSLGVASAHLDQTEAGYLLAKTGARLANGTKFAFQAEALASATCLMSGRLSEARKLSELGHAKAPQFAPHLRFLTALYFHEGRVERAEELAAKLRVKEPDFSLDSLRDDNYPAASLRRAKLLKNLPAREI